MAIVKDPITQQTGDIGAQNETAYQQDVLGAQKRAQRMANTTSTTQKNIVNQATVEPIKADRLDGTSMVLPEPKQETGYQGLAGSIEEQAKQYSESLVSDKDVQSKKQESDNLLNKLYSKLTGAKGQAQLTDEASGEVDTAKKELNDINNQILQEQNSLRRQVEALEKNPQGLFGGGLDQEIRRVTKESVSRQADLSIIQMAKQNNYSAAKEIADRKVAAQLEGQKNEIEALQFIYQENKEQFTKAEQRQFEAQQSERTRLLNEEETRLKSINDLAIEAASNGAPIEVIKAIQGATDINQALIAGAKYMAKPKTGSGSSSTSSSEFDYGQSILDSNPDASDEELEVALRQNTKLSDSDIDSLIAAHNKKKDRAADEAEEDAMNAEENAPKGSWWNNLVSWGKNLIGK